MDNICLEQSLLPTHDNKQSKIEEPQNECFAQLQLLCLLSVLNDFLFFGWDYKTK